MTGFYIKCNTVLKWLKTNIFTVSKVTEVHLRLSNIYDEFLLQKYFTDENRSLFLQKSSSCSNSLFILSKLKHDT